MAATQTGQHGAACGCTGRQEPLFCPIHSQLPDETIGKGTEHTVQCCTCAGLRRRSDLKWSPRWGRTQASAFCCSCLLLAMLAANQAARGGRGSLCSIAGSRRIKEAAHSEDCPDGPASTPLHSLRSA